MASEFVTLRGKIVFERKTLFIKNWDHSFHFTLLSKISLPVLLLAISIIRWLTLEEPLDWIGAVVFTVLFLSHLPALYTLLIKKSYANRIPLQSVVSVNTVADETNEHQVLVRLYLKNGRYREIPFRKLEGSVEPFVAMVQEAIFQPQTA